MWLGAVNKFKYNDTNSLYRDMNIIKTLKRALGYMSKAGAGLTQPRTPCDVPEHMKEVPDALGLRRENLPASAVESVKSWNRWENI